MASMSSQDQVRALVGGEAPREADRQRVEAERPPQLCDELGRLAAPLGLRAARRRADCR